MIRNHAKWREKQYDKKRKIGLCVEDVDECLYMQLYVACILGCSIFSKKKTLVNTYTAITSKSFSSNISHNCSFFEEFIAISMKK